MTAEETARIVRAEERRVMALRMQLLELHPFWGHLLLQVRVVAALELVAFAATDCVRHIWYNPLRTRHLTLRQLGFVLAHEVGHQVFASRERQRGRQAHLWNCATDYAINRVVARIGHPARHEALYESPDGHYPGLGDVRILLDARWDGRIAEAIYEELAAEALPEPVSVTLTLTMPGEEGEGAGAMVRVPNLSDHGGGIDVHLPDTLTAADRGVLAERLAGAVDAWQRAGRAGDAPGALVRELELGRRGQVPWPRLLRRFVSQATARDDYTLRRPNRRYLMEDLVVPGLCGERVGTVIVAVDTSGSMTPKQLDVVAAELEALTSVVDDLTLLVGDTEVREVVTGEAVAPWLRAARMVGGGGTDHRPFFAWVAERRLHPDVFIGLTDLASRFPERPPPYPVLWVTPEGHGPAPWGQIVVVSSRSRTNGPQGAQNHLLTRSRGADKTL
ncbi:MAG: hypothetical protein EP329_08900 [Deltaproteobacteria bacterium]|nr:MAG: hypothetical protein EP329_08900 [Deltaproteobacteria bacterium]